MNDNPKFEYLLEDDGKSEFLDFLNQLPTKDRDKLIATIQKIQDFGMLIAMRQEWIKRLDKDIFEIRSKVSTNIQRALYFQKVGNSYMITHGFTKKSQKTPKTEIEHAHRLMEKWRKENEK